jgi:hypothetical protein
MTVDEFVEKYTGKKVDFDGAYGAQCVDLARQYLKEVLNVTQWPPVEGAKDFWNGPKAGFDKCGIHPEHNILPAKGDIIIYGASGGNKYGHIAICLDPREKDCLVFQQDGFNQAKGAYVGTQPWGAALGFFSKVSNA